MQKALYATKQLAVLMALVITGAVLLVAVVDVLVARTPSTDSNIQSSVRITPHSQSFSAGSGDIKQGVFKVINTAAESQDIIVYARPYSIHAGAGTPNFSVPDSYSNVYRWIQMDMQTHTVPAQSSLDISYSIKVPVDVPPGSHYGVIFA